MYGQKSGTIYTHMKSAEEGFPESALIGWGDPIKRLLR
jgi:hypothetical protein